MTHHTRTPRRSGGLAALAVTAAVAAALAGCKSSASGAGQPGPAASASAAAASGGSGSSGSSGGSGGSSAGSDYFPVAQGNAWVYKSSVLSGLTSKAIVTNKIIRVVPIADGKKVTMKTIEPPAWPPSLTSISSTVTVDLGAVRLDRPDRREGRFG